MKTRQILLSRLGIIVVAASLLNLWNQPIQAQEKLSSQSEKSSESTAVNTREAEVYNNKGVELAEQGKFQEAIAAFEQAIKIHPTYENAHNNLGLAFGSQHKFTEAVAAFNQAIAINPSNVETYNNLGIALGSQGKFTEAVAAFNHAIDIKPNEPTSHQNLGIAFWSQGKLPEAVASLHKAKELFSVHSNTNGIKQVDEILQQVNPSLERVKSQ